MKQPKKITYLTTDYDEVYTLDDYKEWLRDNCEEIPEGLDEYNNDFRNWQYEMAELDFDDFMSNLKYTKECQQSVVLEGSCGTWQGRREIMPIIYNNVGDAIIRCLDGIDYYEVYMEGRVLHVRASHHDGTNYFTIKPVSVHGARRLGGICCNGTYIDDLRADDTKRFAEQYLY